MNSDEWAARRHDELLFEALAKRRGRGKARK